MYIHKNRLKISKEIIIFNLDENCTETKQAMSETLVIYYFLTYPEIKIGTIMTQVQAG